MENATSSDRDSRETDLLDGYYLTEDKELLRKSLLDPKKDWTEQKIAYKKESDSVQLPGNKSLRGLHQAPDTLGNHIFGRTYSQKTDSSTQTARKQRMGMVDEMKEVGFWKAIFAEFLATTIFLLNIIMVACGSGVGTQQSFSASTVSIGIGIALSISTLAQAIGHVSGGHINPAVTAGMMAIRKISPIKGFLYIIAQLLGAVAGSGLGYGLTPAKVRGGLGINALNEAIGVKPVQGFGLELFFTFLLVLTVCAVTDPGKKVEPYGTTLAIGISILVCHVCLIPYTGCSVNPARSFGPAVVTNSWDDHWIFWIGPMLGGVLGAILYEYVFKTKEA
ncbi:aquaporin-1-like isoform X3 [Rhopilema esculentum]|uniref:aquaporin-1-like isoform X3 n=1 Tax=Rhopilema esculentum TaxID=499914 RepID=UPI0031E44532